MAGERTNGYDTPPLPSPPLAYDFLFVKSRPQNPMCQVIPAPCPFPGSGPYSHPYPHQFRDPGHAVPIPTLTHNLGKPNLTIVTLVT